MLANRKNLRGFVRPPNTAQTVGRLRVYSYKAPGACRAVLIDEDFVAIGAYIYMTEETEGCAPYTDIRGGELPMMIFTSSHSGFGVLRERMLGPMIENWLSTGLATLKFDIVFNNSSTSASSSS